MKKRRIAIGGLLLPQDSGWEFSEKDSVITGRRDGPGKLQILFTAQNVLPQPVTHDFCLQVMRFLVEVDAEPTDCQAMESVCGPYGAATFTRTRSGTEELVRAWYCRRPPGLIYGIYSCPLAAAHSPAYELATRQCAHIMAEVLFDRISWGASAEDDPLTKVLLENFERLENQR
jgi:hypothetical protein